MGVLVVIALLLSTPSMIFAKSLAVVDTELREASPDARRVLTKVDLGDTDQLHALPTTLGEWQMRREYDWDNVAAILNTDVLLSRDYKRPDVHQPVHLLIVQSSNVSSFHPAPLCYKVQGWQFEPEGLVASVHVKNASWAQQTWLSEDEPLSFSGNLTAKALVIHKEGERGEIVDKRVVLYVYLKKDDWRVTQEVTWVRTEIRIPATTPPEEALPILASLLGEAVPHLFSFDLQGELTLAESLVRERGVIGIGIIALAIAIPASISLLGRGARAGRP